MAVALVGSGTNHNVSSTIGSGVPATFAYTAPVGANVLVVCEVVGCSPQTIPTALSYQTPSASPIAFTNVAGSFVSEITNVQASFWYLTTTAYGSSFDGGSHTFSITYTQSVTGGGAIFFLPLSGVDPSAPVGTPATGSLSGTGTAVATTLAAATANDLLLGCFGASGLPTATDPQTNIFNSTSRGSIRIVASQAPGNTAGTFSWTLGTATDWAATSVAFLAPVVIIPPVPSRGPMPKQIYIMP